MTKTNLSLSDAEARSIYPTAPPSLKAIMENSFKKGFFSTNIIDRINTFADICELNGTTEDAFYKECAECRLRPHEIANRQREMICVAYNEGWIPDYNNYNEQKWSLWFYMDSSGFRLRDAHYGNANTYVGARLVFKSKELALDSAAKFLPIYEASLTFKSNVNTASQPMAAVSNDPFERDCKKLGYDHSTIIPDLSRMPEDLKAPVRSFIRLLVGTAAKNDNHKFDYQNSEEEKWYGWWDMEVDENNPSGFRLGAAYCVNSHSYVGARLSLRSEKDVREVAAEYEPDYRNVFKQ